ncbi:hypothetical protein [Thermosipho sp. (in: thermotogales)]|jgi:DNA replication protein DnaC|uniref:hypothetical protein n=1 Tax=Thermosipho sp. (in: thermotogales) TaxID=1968895 RepID=UPI0025808428|nr:hypothetical protein [Thermosipho sp. (in: thermotogales)]
MRTKKTLSDSEIKKYSVYNLPKKFIKSTLDDFKIIGDTTEIRQHNTICFKRFKNYMNNLDVNLECGRGLAICGPVGVGKTMLMTILAKEIIKIFDRHNFELNNAANKFYFIQASRLYDLANRQGLNEDDLNIRNSIKDLSGLWIDDLTKFGETGKGNELIYLDDIIRYRDLNVLPTFYTIQVPFKLISKVLSIPIYDIIRGNCEVIEFRGKSMR